MKPPSVVGLQAAATFVRNLEPDFSAIPESDHPEARQALDVLADATHDLREALDQCPACGVTVREGLAH